MNRNVLRVGIVGPPLTDSGGIGTLFQYYLANRDPEIVVRIFDSRGRGRSPWSSAGPWLRTVILLSSLRVLGRVNVVHVNFGARGSAVRKLPLIFFVSTILRVPVVAQLHSSSFDLFFNRLSPHFQRLVRFLLCRATVVLSLGQKWQTYLTQSVGLPTEKVIPFVMGVPAFAADHSRPSRIQTLLFAGEMGERKGLPQLIEAVSKLSGLNLVVAGKGNLAEFRAMAAFHGVADRCCFLGLIPAKGIHRLLEVTDAMVLPSRAEGLPVSVLESFSAGVTPIVTNVGSMLEFCQDGVNCILLQSQSASDICVGITRLQELSAASGPSVAKAAIETWRNHFDVSKTSATLESIWWSASQSRPSRSMSKTT